MDYNLNARIWFFVLPLVLSLQACANKSYLLKNSNAKIGKWKSVAVLPCGGPNQGHNQVATDLIQMLLLKQTDFKVIEPKIVYSRSSESIRKAEDGVFSSADAVTFARKANADAVILCTITSHNTDGMMNGFATLKLIDSQSEDLVFTTHEPSGLLFANSVEQCVHAATENATENLTDALKEIAAGKF